MATKTKFYRDKQNGKIEGVCAGLADYTGFDVNLIRVAAIVLLFATSGWMLLAYIVAACVAPKKPKGLYDTPEDAKFWQGVRANPRRSTTEVRSKLRDIDRRLADMETHFTSRNTQLASEIDALR